MKTIICGSRSILDIKLIESAIKESNIYITEVICGEAKGADKLGKEWAIKNNIPVISFPANWYNLDIEPKIIRYDRYNQQYNLLAGYNRNKQMLEYIKPNGAVIAIWAKNSHGTKNMIEIAQKAGIKVYIKRV